MSLSQSDRLRPVTGIIPAIRARWMLLPIGLVIGVIVGLTVAAVVPTTYRATGTVHLGAGLVSVGEMNPNSSWAADQVVLAGTPEVLQGVRDRVGGLDVDGVASHLSVSQRADTSYVDFTYTGDSAADAERGANAAMEVYLGAAQAAAEQRLTEQSDLLTRLIATSPDWELADLEQQRQALARTVVDPGEVAKSATGNAERATVDLAAFPLAGGLGGLLLAAAAAYLLEVFRPKVRSSEALNDVPVRKLGRLDESGRALIPVAEELEALELPEDQLKPKIGVAVLGSARQNVVGAVKRALRSHLPTRRVKTVPVDLGTGSGIATARKCDGLLLVAVEGKAGINQLEDLVRRLEIMRIEPLGLITVLPRGLRWFR
jgi:hypothetical protein